MCREKSRGGRRCPCTKPVNRSAYRQAAKTAKEAAQLDIVTLLPENALQETLTREEILALIAPPQQEPPAVPLPVYTEEDFLPENLPATTTRLKTDWVEHANHPPDHPHMLILEEATRRVGQTVERQALLASGLTEEELDVLNAENEKELSRIKEAYDAWEQEEQDLHLQYKTERDKLAKMHRDAIWNRNAEHDEGNLSIEEITNQIEALDSARNKTLMERRQMTSVGVAPRAAEIKWWSMYGDTKQRPYSPTVAKKLARLSQGYMETLTKIRDMGGEIVFETVYPQQRSALETEMKETAHFYPTEWITQSNQREKLAVAFTGTDESKIAGAYRSNTLTERYTLVDDVSYTIKHDISETEKAELRRQGWTEIVSPDQPLPEGVGYSAATNPNETRWYKVEKETYTPTAFETENAYSASGSFNPPPPETGQDPWVDVTPPKPEWDMEGRQIHLWERTRKKIRQTHVNRYDTLQVFTPFYFPNPERSNEEAYGDESDLGRTFVHEFAHRCEDVNATIGAAENVFIVRRTTDENGQRHPLISTGEAAGARINVRPDSFTSPYMGRDYEHASGRNVHYELFSTGMEALFGGAYGNLLGVKEGTSPDDEHRHLVLGLLASV